MRSPSGVIVTDDPREQKAPKNHKWDGFCLWDSLSLGKGHAYLWYLRPLSADDYAHFEEWLLLVLRVAKRQATQEAACEIESALAGKVKP